VDAAVCRGARIWYAQQFELTAAEPPAGQECGEGGNGQAARYPGDAGEHGQRQIVEAGDVEQEFIAASRRKIGSDGGGGGNRCNRCNR
jgi:hypothetical protein